MEIQLKLDGKIRAKLETFTRCFVKFMLQNIMNRETLAHLYYPLVYGYEDEEENWVRRRIGKFAEDFKTAKEFKFRFTI